MMTPRRFHPLVIIFFLGTVESFSQGIILAPDSIPVIKERPLKQTYFVQHPAMEEISITTGKAKPADRRKGKFGKGLFGGTLTLFTGISTSSDEESLFIVESSLRSTNKLNDWNIPLYFRGNLSKERERVRNDDGSSSLSTTESIEIFWDKGVSGFIIRDSDTLGTFDLIIHFPPDSEPDQWLRRMENERRVENIQHRRLQLVNSYRDFHLSGSLNGKRFSVIRSGRLFRSLILINGEPVAIFQSDPDFHLTGKKNRVSPYLLVDKSAHDETRKELFHLAMLNRLMAGVVQIDTGGM